MQVWQRFTTLLLCLITPTLVFAQIHIINLHGDDFSMGQQYGQQLQTTLHTTLNTLENYYVTQHHLSYNDLVIQSEKLYQRFPSSLQARIQGEAQGANLSLNDAMILNAMETLGTLLDKPIEHCAFAFLPPTRSTTHASLIGRNYDYSEPFNDIASNLTVAVFHKPGAIATASIALPGEMYCPNCANADGIFLELNNGSPSGGSTVNTSATSLLATMQTSLEQAHSISEISQALNHLPADFSLIINAADAKQANSFEFSSTLGMKTNTPVLNNNFVSTNFYLNPNWQNIPKPNDISTWEGITRRNNLLKLMSQQTTYNLEDFKQLMDKNILQGGAKWLPTIYQIIYDTHAETLYLRTKQMNNWQQVALQPLFNG